MFETRLGLRSAHGNSMQSWKAVLTIDSYLVIVNDVHNLLLEVLAEDVRCDLRGLLDIGQFSLLLGRHEIRKSAHNVNRLHVALLLAPKVAP